MPRAVGLTEQLLGHFKTRIGSLEVIPSSGGCFEIALNGRKIFSKLESGRFPEAEEVVRLLEKG